MLTIKPFNLLTMIKVLIRENENISHVMVPALNTLRGANVPNIQVLKSAAGFYIGTLCKAEWYDKNSHCTPDFLSNLGIESCPDEFWEPYDRLSDCYWDTREKAEQALISGVYPLKF
jgi:hypothetical protein